MRWSINRFVVLARSGVPSSPITFCMPCLACNWDDFKDSQVLVLPTDVSPHALIWALQIGDRLSKSEPLCSALNWYLAVGHSPMDACAALLAKTKECVLHFEWRDPSVEKVCDFHGVSLKFNFSFSVGAPECIHLTLPNETLVGWVLTTFPTFAVERSLDLPIALTDLAVRLLHSFCSKADLAMSRKRDERIVGVISPAAVTFYCCWSITDGKSASSPCVTWVAVYSNYLQKFSPMCTGQILI